MPGVTVASVGSAGIEEVGVSVTEAIAARLKYK